MKCDEGTGSFLKGFRSTVAVLGLDQQRREPKGWGSLGEGTVKS